MRQRDSTKRRIQAMLRMMDRYTKREGRSMENFSQNLAFAEQAALIDLLIEKGLITDGEYDEKVIARLEAADPAAG